MKGNKVYATVRKESYSRLKFLNFERKLLQSFAHEKCKFQYNNQNCNFLSCLVSGILIKTINNIIAQKVKQ